MPSKKKKYNARFPPARIKKIMQTDEEIGKVAAAVPVIISRALELFLESLLKNACHVTQSRNAKTMTTSHLKQCIELEQQFDFLKDLVASVPDMQGDAEENHVEGERAPRRGRKPGSGRKNGGTAGKGRDAKQSGTDSEQEDDTEDSESNGDEEMPQATPAARPTTHLSTLPSDNRSGAQRMKGRCDRGNCQSHTRVFPDIQTHRFGRKLEKRARYSLLKYPRL
ncbi:dr1-associated corepressor isoform X1 [Anolis carolinensis]|uniref:dr1-associated corepressor isoform X1 n=1 Tax=Anolis carolinensis TaxID=28377 RepID=UPI002F2B7DC4